MRNNITGDLKTKVFRVSLKIQREKKRKEKSNTMRNHILTSTSAQRETAVGGRGAKEKAVEKCSCTIFIFVVRF